MHMCHSASEFAPNVTIRRASTEPNRDSVISGSSTRAFASLKLEKEEEQIFDQPRYFVSRLVDGPPIQMNAQFRLRTESVIIEQLMKQFLILGS